MADQVKYCDGCGYAIDPIGYSPTQYEALNFCCSECWHQWRSETSADAGCYLPTREVIAAEAAKIREGWYAS